MNYLAHAFLSGPDTAILTGNFIADAVRGKQILMFPEAIQKGIVLHRQIDAFTDSHLVVNQTKNRLRLNFGKYAPVIADMFYDHFLAADFNSYSAVPLPEFSQKVYQVIQTDFNNMPEKVKHFLPYMIEHNWLVSYAQLAGIHKALTGLSRRTSFISGMETAAFDLEKNYSAYKSEFDAFFPELVQFSENRLALLSA